MKVELSNLYEPALRRTPSGKVEYIWRVRHNDVRSPRLKRLERCVAEATRGRRYRGQGAAEDQREVRQAMAQAARECAEKGRR